MFAREAKSHEALLDVLDEVILFNNNCEVGEGVEIAKKYGVGGYPTFIMVNPEGEVSSAWIGYPGAEKWAALARAGDRDRRTIAAKTEAYAQEPTKELACALAQHASSSYGFVDAVKYFRAAREMDPANAPEYTEEILTNMYYGARRGGFTLDEVKQEADHVMASPQADPAARMNVAMLVRGMARAMGETEVAIPYITQAMEASEGIEELAAERADLAVDHALLVLKDKDRALTLKREAMPEGWQEDAGRLNSFAWWCFENRINLAEAKKLALKGVELADSDGDKANILDTAAEICAAMDDGHEAVELIRRAVELKPDRKYLQDQLVRFEEELKKKG